MRYTEACQLLGLEPSSELADADLKKAFKRAALKHHPDKNLHNAEEAKETFQMISKAYNFLCQCVARGQTGRHQPRFATADNYEDEEEDGYYYYDEDESGSEEAYADMQDILFQMLFAKMYAASHGGAGLGGFARAQGYGTRGGGVGGMAGVAHPFIFVSGGGARASAAGFSVYGPGMDGSSSSRGGGRATTSGGGVDGAHASYARQHEYYDAADDDDDDDDDEIDDMFERMAERARRQDEAHQKAKQRQEEHAKYMAERARQAELEGRDFFESWNVKQLKGECQRRGISVKNLQQNDIVEVLIADEAKKRLREQLKQEAPLLDEWAEVILMKHRPDMNGMKVRVIDFFDEKYTVEWDTNAGKKKKKGYTRESRKARVKPENLRLWGTGEPLNSPSKPSVSASESTGSDKENKDKQQAPSSESSNKSESNNSKSTATANDEKATPKAAAAAADPKPPPPEPEVPTTKCCAICRLEHDISKIADGDDDKPKESTSSSRKTVILCCGHIFCADCCGAGFLPDPTSKVEIRCCRVCSTNDPGVSALESLPYVVDLRDPPQTLLDSMYEEYSLIITCENIEAWEKKHQGELTDLEARKNKAIKLEKDAIAKQTEVGAKEKKGKLIKKMLASVEKEFEPKWKELVRKHANLWRSVAKKGTLKELQAERDATKVEVSKGINKHYRRASIKVHPDRHGAEYQKEFDALTKARDTLSDVDLRHAYVEQMLKVVCKVGTHWVTASHESWVLKYQPDLAEQNPSTKKDEPGIQRPLQIEGGMMQTTPRKPGIAVLSLNDRRVRVTLHIPERSWYEFNSYCQAVHLMAERCDAYNEEMEEEFVKTVRKESFKSRLNGEIDVELTLPEPGLWDIRWSFTVEMEPGNVKNSVRSCDARVDLVSPAYKAKLQLLHSFEAVAMRRASEIHTAIRKLSNNTRSNNSGLIGKYESFQESILRGKHALYHLERACADVGATMTAASSPLGVLRAALAETRSYKQELDEALATQEKKAALKNFKNMVYDILETGDASAWVATVTEETLKNDMKGDANRLYQLLMEGKKAYHLELVDAATLCSAAARDDIFSKKQLQALCDRSVEVEVRAAEEARRLTIENEKREAEEKDRLSLEKRAAFMERGVTVQIKGLQKVPALNGRLATYMGLGQGDRYILRLNDGREIALKKHNFYKWNGLGEANFGPTPTSSGVGWSCNTCTFFHEGPNADGLVSCSMCGASKNGVLCSPPASDKSTKTSTSNNLAANQSSSKPKQQQKVEVAETPRSAPPTHQMSPHGKSPLTASKISKPKQQKAEEATVTVPETASVPVTGPETASEPASVPVTASVTSQRQLVAPGSPTMARQKAPGVKSPPRKDSTAKSKEKPQCRFGKHCRNIAKNGSCKFRHSAEDIAFIKGKVPAVPVGASADPIQKSSPETRNRPVVITPESSKTFQRTILIDAKATGVVIGTKGRNVHTIRQKTRTKIIVNNKEPDADGMCSVHVTGPNQEAVDMAVSMVQAKADSRSRCSPQDVASTEHSSIGTIPSFISGPMQSEVPAAMTPISPVGAADLDVFLYSHKTFLKCSPEKFLKWLKAEDIATVSDLADACGDEEFISELVVNGLKRFKLAAFSKSAAAVAAGK